MKVQLEMTVDGAWLRTVGTPDDVLTPHAAEDDAREDLLALYDVAYGRLGPAGLFVAFDPVPIPFARAA